MIKPSEILTKHNKGKIINLQIRRKIQRQIFKSENTGQTWTPIFDDAMSLSIGDMEMAPSNNEIIYVGTGEPNAGGGSLAYDGLGVYKTSDGGNNWQHQPILLPLYQKQCF